MKKNFFSYIVIGAVFLLAIEGLKSCSSISKKSLSEGQQIDSLQKELDTIASLERATKTDLSVFDTLDFTVFSNQQWLRLHESHSENILVHWPDGHTTKGIEQHIKDLKAMFVYAPNTSIQEHPVKFGFRNMTCVTGVMTGTFTKPMPLGNGQFIEPTGKSFSLPMCTVGKWESGVMTEEYLFWDNQTYMKQLGLK